MRVRGPPRAFLGMAKSMWSGATLIFCVPEDSVLFSLLAPPSVCVAVWQLANDALTMPAAPPMASRVALNLHAIVQARVPRRSIVGREACGARGRH